VFEAELAERYREAGRSVAGAVIAHHGVDADATVGIPGDCPPQKCDCGVGCELVEHFGVGQSGVVVDHHVQKLVAGDLAPGSLDPTSVLAARLAEHAMPRTKSRDAAELFDVGVDALTGMPALVAVGRFGWLQP